MLRRSLRAIRASRESGESVRTSTRRTWPQGHSPTPKTRRIDTGLRRELRRHGTMVHSGARSLRGRDDAELHHEATDFGKARTRGPAFRPGAVVVPRPNVISVTPVSASCIVIDVPCRSGHCLFFSDDERSGRRRSPARAGGERRRQRGRSASGRRPELGLTWLNLSLQSRRRVRSRRLHLS
jgi:hypothetical protein